MSVFQFGARVSKLPASLRRLAKRLWHETDNQLLEELREKRTQQEAFPVTLPNGWVVEGLSPLEAYHEVKDLFFLGLFDVELQAEAPRIIDGGAYMGLSILRYKHLWPLARITAFECAPQVLPQLQQNLAENGIEDVEVIEKALAGCAEERFFHSPGDDCGRMIPADESNGDTRVQTVRLSDYLNEPVDILKLNIEGAELEVLREVEASGRLNNIRNLVMEVHSFDKQAQFLGEILQILSRNNFRYMLRHYDDESNLNLRPPYSRSSTHSWEILLYAHAANN